MKTSELIELLKKCDPDAEVLFCNDNGRADIVWFVENSLTYGQVLFYEDEPNWDESCEDDPTVEIDTIVRTGDCFAETTYREIVNEN